MRIKRITGAILAAMTLLTACAGNSTQAENRGTAEPDRFEVKAIEAVIPDPVAEGTDAAKFAVGDAHWEWWQDYREKVSFSNNQQEGMEQYYELIQKELLANAADKNAVCSPLNIYIALSMLAEVTDGNTRDQILDVLKTQDMEALQNRVKALWEANYLDTPVVKCLLANSMWLRNDIGYHEDTLKCLSEEYHASSYCGEMGSAQLNQQLRKWTDEHTGGRLTDDTKDLELQPESVLALISTIYYKASWNDKFPKDRTDEGIFHGLAGDQTVPMMHRDDMMNLYQAEHFRAVGLGLADSGTMYFFLPEEGYSAQEITADPEMIRICMDPTDMNSETLLVHMAVPKWDVSYKINLLDHFKALGIQDVLSAETADFRPLTDDVYRIWLSGAEHAAMVKIDEEGVTGAAYTDLEMCAAGDPDALDEVDFILDRPFVFAVAAPDGSILFSGVVQNAE